MNRISYPANIFRIELIITYRCNRRCFNCEAQVRQAPDSLDMTLKQITKFVAESKECGRKWDQIRVLGGEPTLHNEIDEIIKLLCDYKKSFSPNTQITIVTNGYGEYVTTVLKRLKERYDIVIENSHKISDIQPSFSPINQAPLDECEYHDQEYSKGCWIPTICGIALDKYGYYPCSASAAADRIFGADVGKKSLPLSSDVFRDDFRYFCSRCGHFLNEINYIATEECKSTEEIDKLEELINSNQAQMAKKHFLFSECISPTWANALKKWKENKPAMTEY